MTEKSREPHDPTDMRHPDYDRAKDPLSPFYVPEGDEAESEGRSDPPADDTYKVGPGFPPKQYTWKKGGPTPNPKGRPKKVPTMKPDVKKAFEDAIFDKVEVKKGDKKVWISKINLGLQQLATQFAKGDRHARRDVLQYAAQLGVDLQAKDIIAEALGVNEQAIVDAAFRRKQQQAAPEVSPDDHVKAPLDLLDDDVASSDSTDSASQPEAKQPPEPALNKKSRPMSEAESRYAREQHSHFLAEQKKKQGGS
jgi:hypothetical protein